MKSSRRGFLKFLGAAPFAPLIPFKWQREESVIPKFLKPKPIPFSKPNFTLEIDGVDITNKLTGFEFRQDSIDITTMTDGPYKRYYPGACEIEFTAFWDLNRDLEKLELYLEKHDVKLTFSDKDILVYTFSAVVKTIFRHLETNAIPKVTVVMIVSNKMTMLTETRVKNK